jgi:hypothetical protein
VHEARQTRGTAHPTTPKTRGNSAVNVKKNSQLKPHHTKNKGKQRCEFKKNISTETTPHHTKNRGNSAVNLKEIYLN